MLFQPTSITPDQLGSLGNGVAFDDEKLTISWMVNGNSAMTAFCIDYYENSAESSFLFSTGKKTTGCPFYGTDAKGNRQVFSYTDETLDLSVTNKFKFVITQWWSDEDSVAQSSPSTFVVRKRPTLTINVPSSISTRDYTFNGSYSQAEEMALNWVQWKLASGTADNIENVLYDSGNIYGTALLECYYDGFFTGNNYCINLIVETQDGVKIETGWKEFKCEYETGELAGSVNAVRAESGKTAVKVTWSGFRYIYGKADGNYSISDGILTLPKYSDVTWDDVNGSPMSIATPWNIIYKGKLVKESARLFQVEMDAGHTLSLRFTNDTRKITLRYDNTMLYRMEKVAYDSEILALVTPTTFYLRLVSLTGGLYPDETVYPTNTLYPMKDASEGIVTQTAAITYTQEAITSVMTLGAQECDFLQVITGDVPSDITSSVINGEYISTPVTGTEFLCDFTDDLSAGTLYVEGTRIDGWAIYRQETGKSTMLHVLNADMDESMFYDYSARSSAVEYTYQVFPIGTDKYITAPFISNAITPVFWNWAILECSYDDDNDYFVVENEFLFGKNLESSSMSNNNSPSVFSNFTRYPLVQLSPHRYRSGTLESLIGTIKAGKYSDTIEQMEAIDELSNTTNSLFLKNRKGDIWEIRISDAISFSTMDGTREQATTASISWVQIADASEVSIIQKP